MAYKLEKVAIIGNRTMYRVIGEIKDDDENNVSTVSQNKNNISSKNNQKLLDATWGITGTRTLDRTRKEGRSGVLVQVKSATGKKHKEVVKDEIEF